MILPETEQASSRPGAGSGRLESQGWAGAAVLQTLSAPAQPASFLKQAKHSSSSALLGHLCSCGPCSAAMGMLREVQPRTLVPPLCRLDSAFTAHAQLMDTNTNACTQEGKGQRNVRP